MFNIAIGWEDWELEYTSARISRGLAKLKTEINCLDCQLVYTLENLWPEIGREGCEEE